MRAARLRSPRPGKPGKRLSCLLLLYPISSCRYMPYRTEERDFRTQLCLGTVRLWRTAGIRVREGLTQARMYSQAEHFCIFFRYYLPYGIRSSPVCSLCWPSTSIAGWHTAAFPGNRPFPFPLKIGEYFVFSSRDAGTFTSSDCFGHRVRIRTVKEGTAQDASGLLWLFFLIRNISGKKPDHWIKSVFLDIKRIQALSCV